MEFDKKVPEGGATSGEVFNKEMFASEVFPETEDCEDSFLENGFEHAQFEDNLVAYGSEEINLMTRVDRTECGRSEFGIYLKDFAYSVCSDGQFNLIQFYSNDKVQYLFGCSQ